MRFIGNKENIIDKLYFIMSEKGVKGSTFFDFCCGTTSVAKYFKRLNYKVYSSDILYFSYCLQKAYIENNEQPKFERIISYIRSNSSSGLLLATPLEEVVSYLNVIQPHEGFIFNNYTPSGTKELPQPRMYFSDDNGRKIDAIIAEIREWRSSNLLTESEYYILVACLIESVPFYANISGVYAAFHKKWDPRAVKPLLLRPVRIVSGVQGEVFNADSTTLCASIDVDILYIDPPYNERQYAPNYHLLETIARDDNPLIKGITGMRGYEDQKSKFCNSAVALTELDFIAKTAKYKYLVLSYNSEGIMSSDNIIEVLSRYGEVDLSEFEYLRFKSNSKGESKTKKHVLEQLYILKRK